MKYWLWIIPIDRKRTRDLWDFCLQEGVAAMQYEIGVQKKAKQNRALAQQIAVDDKVVAYLNQNRVGGVGTVTRPFFDDPTGYQSATGSAYGQRIGVDWLAAAGDPIDVRKLPIAMSTLKRLVLQGQTIHPIDQAAFEQIAEAVRITRENPLPKIANLLESISLDDVACREAEPWAKQIEPITRPFLEYLGSIIKTGMLLRQDIELVFKTKPRQVKKQATTRDSVSLRLSGLGFDFDVYIGRSLQGFEDRLVWGLNWCSANDAGPVIKEMLDYVKSAGETVVYEVDTVFGGTSCGIFKSLAASELREAHPVKLSHQIFEDLEQMYCELKIGFPERGMKRLMTFMSDRGFHFPPHLVTTYFLSLQTKPFAILTGVSGTGKTKLAQLFAKWMSPTDGERNYAFVPVRPDWTDSRGLLGFHNLITGTYSATDFLRLLLRATINLQSDRRRPYFVILDEMNLAKVEYYFADFLSAMESRRLGEAGSIEQECLILHNQPRCVLAAGNEGVVDPSYYHEERSTCLVRCEKCPFSNFVDEGYHHGEFDYDEARAAGFAPQHFVPPRLTAPLNVYFAGTVNVDETTYMFSPKVLDRANTIEFGDVRLDTYFDIVDAGEPRAPTASEETIAAFTNGGKFALLPKQVPELRSDPDLAPYRDQLVKLNQLLEPFEMHFGYRVADEVLLYLWNARNLWNAPNLKNPDFGLDKAFDHQIYQKVLPKFHGSQAKLQEPLEALRAFCEEHGYAHSTAKIQRMLNMLVKEGFASFA